MNFQNRLFYDVGASEGGAAAATEEIIDKGGEQQQQESVQKDAPLEVPKQIISDEEIKNYGFDSPEALKTFLAKHKESNVPDNVKKEQENIEKANFLKFAAENKNEDGTPLLNVDDFTQYETIKAKADRELVFERYLQEYKTDHPGITDPKDLEEAAKEDFEAEYKLNDSETSRKKGEAKLARDAKDIRSPYEQKVLAAQEEYKEYAHVKQTYPKFEKFIDEAIVRNTPDKLGVVKIKEGDSEVEIEIELTKEDREAIAKTFKTHKTFSAFNSSKPEEIQSVIDNKIQGWLFQNKKQDIVNKTYELGKGVGLRSGSNMGAENLFAFQQGKGAGQEVKGETLDESNKRIAEAAALERQRSGR